MNWLPRFSFLTLLFALVAIAPDSARAEEPAAAQGGAAATATAAPGLNLHANI
jgi:hypothetical protein